MQNFSEISAVSTFWSLLNEYLDEYFQANQEAIEKHWDEIENLNNDLKSYLVVNKDLPSYIRNIKDLKQFCAYVMFNCSFQHSWIHFKDREHLMGKMISEQSEITKGQNGLTNTSVTERIKRARAVQYAVMYFSYWKKQFPAVDPVLGVDKRLRELLWKHSAVISRGIPIADIITSPST